MEQFEWEHAGVPAWRTRATQLRKCKLPGRILIRIELLASAFFSAENDALRTSYLLESSTSLSGGDPYVAEVSQYNDKVDDIHECIASL